MNKFEYFFWHQEKSCLIHKWHHYFKIYETYASKFIGTSPNILEIGLWKGGSLEMWNYYFNGECSIHGIDINQECKYLPSYLNAENINVSIGDQSNTKFWENFFTGSDLEFDIIIDDGGHRMKQQITSFECCFPYLSNGGIYVCEDTHTSYMKEYGGDLKNENSFMNYMKNYLDKIHSNHFDYEYNNKYPAKGIESIHFYDSITVVTKSIDPEFKPVATVR